MAHYHIFQASGDSCPICLALDGQKVPPGYTPHAGCQCQTVRPASKVDCQWGFRSLGTTRLGPGSYNVLWGYEVVVKCPDGSVTGVSGQFDCSPHTPLDTDFETVLDELYDEIEAVAQQLCDNCPSGSDEEFRCC